MSITDELRNIAAETERADGRCDKLYRRDLERIADRIDDASLSEYNAAYNRGYDEGFASDDNWMGQHEDVMEEHGWVRLPKDAYGEYIHFGDVLDQFGTPMTVYAMSDPDPDQGDCMLELITDGVSDSTWVRARKMRHYRKPTVEDVLREFTDAVLEWAGKSGTFAEVGTWSDVAAQYVAKLRLADDEKEQ